MKTYKQLKTELLKNKKVKSAYEKLDFEFAKIANALDTRIKISLSKK